MTSLTSLSRQDTLPASDPIWTKSESCVPGLPMPIPPRNEPSLSFYIVPIGDDIDGHSLTRVTTTRSTPRSLPQTLHLQVAEADKDVPTSVTPESFKLVGLSYQDTILASDPIWTKSPTPSLTPHLAPRSLPQTLSEVDTDVPISVQVTPESGLQFGGLSHQDTLLASDPIWTKSPCVPGIPTPIPPRNEPLISTYVMSALNSNDIDTSTNCN